MKKINTKSTKIFCRLLKKLNNGQHVKFTSTGFMPLTLELVDDNIRTAYGAGKRYSLAHHFEQNGDLMRDPEMCFIVIDSRTKETEYDFMCIYPQYLLMDSVGLEEESILIVNNAVQSYKEKWQAAHCNFANQWLQNIRQQDFLK